MQNVITYGLADTLHHPAEHGWPGIQRPHRLPLQPLDVPREGVPAFGARQMERMVWLANYGYAIVLIYVLLLYD